MTAAHPNPKPRRPVEILALVAMTLAFFAPLMLTGKVLVSRDLYFLYYPGYPFYREMLSSGELPLWNPYCGCGEPFLADMQRAVLYPPNLLYLIAPTGLATVILTALHVLLAGLGAYALCRAWRVSPAGSLLAGVVFAFNSFTVTRYEFPAGLHATAWYPFVLLFFARWLRLRRRPALLLAAVALALQLLAGYPEASLFTLASLALYALFVAVYDWHAHRTWRRLIAPFAGLLVIGALAAGLAMIQLLPTWQASNLSYRTQVDPEPNKASIHPMAVFTLLVPSLYGAPEHAGAYWAPSCEVYWLGAFYVGIVPVAIFLTLLFARLSGRATPPSPQDNGDPLLRSRTPFLLALLILFFLYALGKYTPVFGALWHTVTLLHRFRWPAKCLMCVVLALACLAGIGLDALDRRRSTIASRPNGWRRSLSDWGPLIVFAAVALFIALCLTNVGRLGTNVLTAGFNLGAVPPEDANLIPWSILIRDAIKLPIVGLVAALLLRKLFLSDRRRTLAAGLLIALAFADLLVSNQFLMREGPPRLIDEPLKRLTTMRPDGTLLRHQGGWPLLVGTYAIHGGGNFWSYDAHRVIGLLAVPSVPEEAKSRLRELVNCARIVRFQDITGLLEGDVPTRFDVTQLPKPLPRAVVVGGVRPLDSWDELIGALLFGQLDPLAAALTLDPRAKEAELANLTPGHVQHTVQITDYHPNRLAMKVHSRSPGLLVLSDTYYPGWLATVSGKDATIYQVNGAFRGVRVPAGLSTVEMVYRPTTLRIGAIISLAALLLTALLALPARRPPPPPHPPPPPPP
ncbi:MAG: YfhO family protein, partial [Phycisphaerae bacterium]|nr:YfhO family protein [Phycisphaerae bacterium]